MESMLSSINNAKNVKDCVQIFIKLTDVISKLESEITELKACKCTCEKANKAVTESIKDKSKEYPIKSVILADSNRKFVNPSGLCVEDRKAIVVPCSTLDEVKPNITKSTQDQPISPDTVIIATGTNNWDTEPVDTIIRKTAVAIQEVNKIWPKCKVKIQEILPRSDKTEDEITDINTKLFKMCKDQRLYFIRTKLSKDDLHDVKHIRKTKIPLLASSWKHAANYKQLRKGPGKDNKINKLFSLLKELI